MFLTSLTLTNFRNYKKREFPFSNLATVLVGKNTIGKTSVIEAIFYLATGKSFRAERDTEAITFKEEAGRIEGKIKFKDDAADLQVILNSSEQSPRVFGKKFLVNGVPKRMIDFAGILRAVLFRPEDIDLITGSPSARRRYLDFVLMQVDREYRRSLIAYEKGVRQRNRLLERIRDGLSLSGGTGFQKGEGWIRNQLMFWDQLLIKNGTYISQKREEYLDFVNQLKKYFGDFKLIYDASRISPARLLQYSQEEIAAGVTLVGPHRDDFKIVQSAKLKDQNQVQSFDFAQDKSAKPLNFETIDMSVYGSRGEQRLAILWLKMAELDFLTQMSSERPILLLDDIFSELDYEHRKLIFDIIDKQQTIITTADKHYIEEKREMEIVEL